MASDVSMEPKVPIDTERMKTTDNTIMYFPRFSNDFFLIFSSLPHLSTSIIDNILASSSSIISILSPHVSPAAVSACTRNLPNAKLTPVGEELWRNYLSKGNSGEDQF
ncbi:unnamed protein product [Arctogadus glacialis]